MAGMNVFESDAFSAISMSASVDQIGYKPSLLGTIPGLFVPNPVRTTDVWIESRANGPALIQTDPRGAPPARKGAETRAARSFPTVRIAQSRPLHAHELQNIRAFGSETELQQVQAEVARKQFLMRQDVELTLENYRLGCIQGLVTDANGDTLFDWASLFGQTIPTEIDFDLDNATPDSGAVRKKCTQVVRSIVRGLKGLGGGNIQIGGLVGDDFWDLLIAHEEVRETYKYQAEAPKLRDKSAFGTLEYGGITFMNYRGTDDGSTVAINAAKAKFFPIGAGIFQMAFAPAESFAFVNTLGQEVYSWVLPDPSGRDAFVDVEMYSYPLPVCTMPQALHRGRMT